MEVVAGSGPRCADAELNAALTALDTVQQFAANRAGSVFVEGDEAVSITPGQRLAQFLKEQLLHRENARRRAEEDAGAVAHALATTEARLATVESGCEVYKKEAGQSSAKAQKLEGKIVELQAKLAAAERVARDSLDAARRKEADMEAVRREANAKVESSQQRLAELEVKLHLSGYGETPVRSNRPRGEVETLNDEDDAAAGKAVSPLLDVFASPEARPFGGNSGRVTAILHESNNNKDEVASIADSDDVIVSEAAAAVRGVAKSAAQRTHNQVAKENDVVENVHIARQRQHATEERLLRSEIGTLERKCERADHMLVKVNHAMRVLQHKLQKERQTAAALQEEKCLLQSQLLAAQERPQGLDPEQLGALLQELAQSRARVETLAEQRATLEARLKAAEGQLTATDRDYAELHAAAEQEASDRLHQAQAERQALELKIDELTKQLHTATDAAVQLQNTKDALQDAQSRCGYLAAELEAERMVATDRAAEIENLTGLAQAFAAELMTAREEEQAEKAHVEQLIHENAGLEGRVEALREAVGRLERDEDVLESLAEGQADLQGRLRQAESAASGARAAMEAARIDLQTQSDYAAELERTIEVLKSELSAAEEHNQTLQAAASGAAEQLIELTQSHEALQKELESAAGELGVATRDSGELVQRIMAAEARAHEAELRAASLQGSLEASEAREGALAGDIHEIGAAAEEAATEAASLRSLVSELRLERDEARARIDRLDANIQALNIECEALRRTSAAAEGTSQQLVDNMCDMSGLIDAVAALQERNRLLQEECEAAAVRAVRAESDRDATAVERASVHRELGFERERLGAVEAAHEILQHGHEALRADYAVASRQLESLNEVHAELRREHAELQQRELELRAAAASATAEGHRLCEEADRLSLALAQAHSQTNLSQTELREVLQQKEKWVQCEQELREKAAVAEKARGLAEGKLVLARQREMKLKEAAGQLRQLQADLEAYLHDSEVLRLEKEAAEDRCAELTGRCMVLLDQMAVLEEHVVAAGADTEQQIAEQDGLREQLYNAVTHAEGLQNQIQELAPLPGKLAEMEAERQETAAWCDQMSAQLAATGDDLATVTKELEAAQERCESLGNDLAAAKERAAAAEGAAAAAETGRLEVAAALASAEQALAAFSEGLEHAKQEHVEAMNLLHGAESERDAALERIASTQAELTQLKEENAALETALTSTRAAQTAVEEALHRRLSELESTSAESSGQSAALEEARRRQIEELQSAVQAGSAACTALAAKVESASKGQQDALEECAELHAENEELEAAMKVAEKKLAAAETALEEANMMREELSVTCASHARAAELLEMECGVLRGQIEFMQNAQAKDADVSESVRQQLENAYEEQRQLRERLAGAEQALARGLQETETALRESEVARRHASTAESRAEEALKAVELAAAETRAAVAAKSESERRVTNLEQQLELSELLKEQGQRDMERARDAASEAREAAQRAELAAADAERRRLAAVAESELVVRDACARMSSQMNVLERVEAALVSSVHEGSAQALARVAEQLAGILAEHHYQQQLEGEESQNYGGSAAVIEGSANAAANSLQHQRSVLLNKLNDVQRGVARLAGAKAVEEEAAAMVTENERAATWHSEKSTLRAVCKLALAVTMDSVGGTQNAPTVAAELEHEVTVVNKQALVSLGLDSLWSSLKRLAHTGPTTRRAAEESTQNLTVQVAELSDRCCTLETEVVTERQRAEIFEEALHNEAQRVQNLIGTIQWATGDIVTVDKEDTNSTTTTPSVAQHLEVCVDALGSAVQRFIRRYRAISRQVIGGSSTTISTTTMQTRTDPVSSVEIKTKKQVNTINEKDIHTSSKIPAHVVGDPYQVDDDEDTISLRARYSTPEVSL
jgi:chromosome segregation ATPase